MSNKSAAPKLDRLTLSARGVDRDFFFRPGSSDDRVIRQVFHDNCYDLARLRRFREIVEFLTRSRRSGKRPLIVDAGANIGASSLYFATKFPDALVIAIEPEFGNYQLLAENVKGLGIRPMYGAIAATNRRVRVVDVGEGFWGYQTRFVDAGDEGLPSTTVQQLYDAYAAEYFPFITKVDIEGGEKELFSQNVAWVDATPLLIVELHDWLLPGQRSSLPFLQCVSRLQRDFVYLGEDVYSIADDMDVVTGGHAAQNPGEKEHPHVSDTSPFVDVVEPSGEEMAAATQDFQTNIAALRNTDAELRSAVTVLTADSEHAEQLLTSTRAALAQAEHALMESQRELADTRHELSELQAREKALVNELSLTLNSLQQLRDQLDESNATVAQTQKKIENVEEELDRYRESDKSQLAAEAAAREKLEAKLRKRNEEMAAFRARKLVRVAVAIGNWLHRRAVHPAR